MKALELLLSEENLLIEDKSLSKRIKGIVGTFNRLCREMSSQVSSFNEFMQSQQEGELYGKIVISKSLAGFFKNNKILRLEAVVESYKNQERAKVNNFYTVKTALLDLTKSLIKESKKDAIISAYDLFGDDLQKCEAGHEIIILNGKNVDVLEHFIKVLDEELVVKGNFENIEAQEVDFNTEVLDRNIELCNRKNGEIYGGKQSKMNKLEMVINHLNEIGKKVVAFYTYKETLLEIGCTPRSIKDYENELSKAYIPLKKTLQKEFRIELEDICNVVVNEEEYSTVSIDTYSENMLDQNTVEETPAPYITEYNPEDYSTQTETPVYTESTPTPSDIFAEDVSNQYTEYAQPYMTEQSTTYSEPLTEQPVYTDPFATEQPSTYTEPVATENTYTENNNLFSQEVTSTYEQVNTTPSAIDNSLFTQAPQSAYAEQANPFAETQNTPSQSYDTHSVEQPNTNMFSESETQSYSSPYSNEPSTNMFEDNNTQPSTNIFETQTITETPTQPTQNMFEDGFSAPAENNNMFENNSQFKSPLSNMFENTNNNSNPFGSNSDNMFE